MASNSGLLAILILLDLTAAFDTSLTPSSGTEGEGGEAVSPVSHGSERLQIVEGYKDAFHTSETTVS